MKGFCREAVSLCFFAKTSIHFSFDGNDNSCGNREISIKNRDFPTRIIELILIFAASI